MDQHAVLMRIVIDRPVPGEVIRRVLEQALRAPSGGNLQPWHLHVVGGAKHAAEIDAKRAIDEATRLAARL